MIKKIAVGGAIAAAIVGVGTAAMATSGSIGSTAGSGTVASSGAAARNHSAGNALARRGIHGQVVTKTKGGSGFTTHDFVRGDVTAVSTSSISVKAADGTTETFAVTSSTKVRVRTNGKGADGTISSVKSGAKVLVVGTGSTSFTATRILVAG